MSIGITDIIAPLGVFPALEDISLKGGYQTVADVTARDAIATNQRKVGMQVYTVATAQLWVLYPGITNGDWSLFTGGASLTAIAPVNVTKAAAAVGVSTEAARGDHKHDVTTAAPATGIGGANSEGTATSLARSDHSHALRTTTGPTDLAIGAVADGEFLKRVGATIVSAAVSGGTSTVQEEGVTQSSTVTTFNFVGSAITASGAGATATITVSLSPALGGAGGIVARRTVTGPTTATVLVTDHMIMVDTTGGAVTLTLPNPSLTDRIYEIKDIAGTFGTNACTLARNTPASDQIEGLVANYLLEAPWQSLRIGSNGVAKWWLL